MSLLLHFKNFTRNKFFETLFTASLFIWASYAYIGDIFEAIIILPFQLELFFYSLIRFGLILLLFYWFLVSYTENFGLKAKADKAYKLGDYKTAINKFNLLLKIFRWNANYYNGRGNCYYKMKNWKRAVDDYSKGIMLEPKAAYIYKNRSNAYKFMGFKSHAKEDLKKYNQLK